MVNRIKQPIDGVRIRSLLPERIYAFGRILFYAVHPDRKAILPVPVKKRWKLYSTNGRYETPTIKKIPSEARFRSKYSKYSKKGFVEVEEDDYVFDIGAFFGGFSIPASGKAKTVVSVEPTPVTYECLCTNTKTRGNIITANNIVSNNSEDRRLKIATDPTDNGVLSPDEGKKKKEVHMETKTIDEISKNLGINKVDFLKIDAEGAEIEVLQGIKNTKVSKMAIDCTAERNGESPKDDIKKILGERDYQVKTQGDVVFGKQNQS